MQLFFFRFEHTVVELQLLFWGQVFRVALCSGDALAVMDFVNLFFFVSVAGMDCPLLDLVCFLDLMF